MPITGDDMKAIKAELDDRYVKIQNCNDTQKEINEKINDNNKNIELLRNDIQRNREEFHKGQNFNNWLTFAVLGTIIAGIIGFYFMNFGG